MSSFPDFLPDDRWIISKRGSKNPVNPSIPYAFLAERERTASGKIEDVAVVFLTNSECPFHCLMCDLWKNTTEVPVRPGTIPRQIEYALNRLPAVKHIKLYNSGSFFDKRAIPDEDYPEIAYLLRGFETVIVESHPAFIGQSSAIFNRMLNGNLEVAMGLETIHPEIIRRLNKKMTLEKFRDSVCFLSSNSINTRAFILLKPPFHSEDEGLYWTERAIDFAFDTGVGCCTVIPVRAGNGAMNELIATGHFNPPTVSSLEKALEYGINLGRGRVFADTWDLQLFSDCPECLPKRTERITEMNLTQRIIPEVTCNCITMESKAG